MIFFEAIDKLTTKRVSVWVCVHIQWIYNLRNISNMEFYRIHNIVVAFNFSVIFGFPLLLLLLSFILCAIRINTYTNYFGNQFNRNFCHYIWTRQQKIWGKKVPTTNVRFNWRCCRFVFIAFYFTYLIRNIK